MTSSLSNPPGTQNISADLRASSRAEVWRQSRACVSVSVPLECTSYIANAEANSLLMPFIKQWVSH